MLLNGGQRVAVTEAKSFSSPVTLAIADWQSGKTASPVFCQHTPAESSPDRLLGKAVDQEQIQNVNTISPPLNVKVFFALS